MEVFVLDMVACLGLSVSGAKVKEEATEKQLLLHSNSLTGPCSFLHACCFADSHCRHMLTTSKQLYLLYSYLTLQMMWPSVFGPPNK